MAQMNVSIPETMKAWCEGQVSTGSYSTTSDYVRDLIRKDQERKVGIAKLQTAIDESLGSGVSDASFDGIMALARAKHAD